MLNNNIRNLQKGDRLYTVALISAPDNPYHRDFIVISARFVKPINATQAEVETKDKIIGKTSILYKTRVGAQFIGELFKMFTCDGILNLEYEEGESNE